MAWLGIFRSIQLIEPSPPAYKYISGREREIEGIYSYQWMLYGALYCSRIDDLRCIYISPPALIYEIVMVWYIFYDLIFIHLILTVCKISPLGYFYDFFFSSLDFVDCDHVLKDAFCFTMQTLSTAKKGHLFQNLDLWYNIVYCNKEDQKGENKQFEEIKLTKNKNNEKYRHRYKARTLNFSARDIFQKWWETFRCLKIGYIDSIMPGPKCSVGRM